MSDLTFLAHFITEEVYLIKEELPEKDKEVAVEEKPVMAPQTEPIVEEVKEQEPVYIKSLPTEGNNLKHCLVFFESDATHLEETKKTFLLKILGAVKRSLDDVLLINAREASLEQINAVLSEFNHRHILAFNAQGLDKLITSAKYQIQEEGKKSFLKADDLALIENEVALKKALWGSLQKMFL